MSDGGKKNEKKGRGGESGRMESRVFSLSFLILSDHYLSNLILPLLVHNTTVSLVEHFYYTSFNYSHNILATTYRNSNLPQT